MGDALQRQIHRICMPSEMVARFEQGHVRRIGQAMRRGETGNAAADHGDSGPAHGLAAGLLEGIIEIFISSLD